MGDNLISKLPGRSLIFIVIFMGILPIFIPYGFAMECEQSSDSSFELILNCIDTIDVKKNTMKEMYADLGNFTNSLEGAKVYDVRTENSVTFATMEIPLPLVDDLKSDVKFTQSSNYFLEFLNGDLGGSSLLISLREINGYDGTQNGGSEVSFNFHIKKSPCFAFGLKCGTAEDFEYALDRGLYLVELKAKDFHENLSKNTELKIKSVSTQLNHNQPNNYPESNGHLTSTITNLKDKSQTSLDDGIYKISAKIPKTEKDTALLGKTCKPGLELVFKPNTGEPACVYPTSVEKLIRRGWTD